MSGRNLRVVVDLCVDVTNSCTALSHSTGEQNLFGQFSKGPQS